jgi:hypothetical protein
VAADRGSSAALIPTFNAQFTTGAAGSSEAHAFLYSATQFRVLIIQGTSLGNFGASSFALSNALSFRLTIRVPIQGWSASQSAASVSCLSNGQCESEFSATVSAAGAVSNENVDFINGNCSLATSTFTCNFNSSFFSVAPNCTFSVVSSGAEVGQTQSVTTSGFVFQTFTSTNGANNARGFFVRCSRGGADYRPKVPAPILTGSVTSNSVNAERFERARVNNVNGSASVTKSSSSWLTAGACGGVGNCNFTITTGAFSSAPECVCSAAGGGAGQCVINTSSATSMQIVTWSPAGVLANESDVKVLCMGPR